MTSALKPIFQLSSVIDDHDVTSLRDVLALIPAYTENRSVMSTVSGAFSVTTCAAAGIGDTKFLNPMASVLGGTVVYCVL